MKLLKKISWAVLIIIGCAIIAAYSLGYRLTPGQVVRPGDPCSAEGTKTIGKYDSGAHSGHAGQEQSQELICNSGHWILPFAP